jgi:hypothetical protein
METSCKEEKNKSVDYQLLGKTEQKQENNGKEKNMTHNQGVAGSSPARPTHSEGKVTLFRRGLFVYNN